MYERLDRSFELLKASTAIFLKHRGLLVFPCLSTMALIVMVGSFAMPLGGTHARDALNSHGRTLSFPQYMTAFLFYFCQYFVIFFFNTALVGAVLIGLTKHVLHSAFLTIVMEIVVICAVVLTALVHATLSGIYKVALFRYANGFSSIAGFDSRVLEQAFQPAG